MNKFRHLVFTCICMVLLTVISISNASVKQGLKNGEKVPNFIGTTMDGTVYRYKNEVSGVIKVINLFSVTCIPCKKEIPKLAHLAEQHKKVLFIITNVDDYKKNRVLAFLDTLGAYPSHIVLSSPSALSIFNIVAMPYTLVVGRDGNIISSFSGGTDENIEKLNTLLLARE